MNARPESWSQPADPQRVALAAVVAVALFLVAWGVLHQGVFARRQIIDTPVYQRYGDAMADGRVPYRDFSVEYPPGALPAFVLPSLGARKSDFEGYRRIFETLMAFCGGAAALLVALALVADGAGGWRLAGGIALAALGPLALGSVVLSRYDLWPAALTVGALAAVLTGRFRLGLGVLGVAVAAKVYPAVLAPLAFAHVWRRAGRREAVVAVGVCVAAFSVVLLPFLVLAPEGVWDSVERQTTRPLQIESFGASLLIAAHHVFGTGVAIESSYGSQNIAGSAAGVLAAIQTVLQVGLLVVIWTLFARGPADRGHLLRASAAAVCAFVALGKVLSPQFLVWLVPLVPLVRGRRGFAAGAVLTVALVLTQLWFPYRYWDLVRELDPVASWLVLARDFVLLTLVALLAWPARARAHR